MGHDLLSFEQLAELAFDFLLLMKITPCGTFQDARVILRYELCGGTSERTKLSAFCVNSVTSFYWSYKFIDLMLNPALESG
jgi:hypothetical protein